MRWREAHDRVAPLLERLGLGERLSHRAEHLSMGERQRVMIARALSTQPRLLLADEPTGSLDTQRGREVLELLRELCREREVAIVLVSHDPQAAAYADRVYALRDGKLGAYEPDRLYTAVKPRNVLHLYRVRLRARLLQECFAIVGIAAGVALLFASQVASSSLSSSVAQLSRGIVGNATLQLLARDPQGFDAGTLAQVRAIAGVRAAAPLLEASHQGERPAARALGGAGRRRFEPDRARRRARAQHLAEPVRGLRRGRAARAAGAQAGREQVRRRSHVPG